MTAPRFGDDASISNDGFGPVCNRCKTPLVVHGETISGSACDVGLTITDMNRAFRDSFAPYMQQAIRTKKR